jgi:hypothetical protein
MVATLSASRPRTEEFASYYTKYVSLVTEEDIVAAMKSQLDELLSLLRGSPEATANTRHAPYTWSVKQVVGHMTDGERVFSYRALRFARKDATPLPGFDENAFMSHSTFDASPLGDILDEFEHLRRANISFFRQLSPEAWTRTGIASDNSVSVRALAYIMVGHVRHHLNILHKRLEGAK